MKRSWNLLNHYLLISLTLAFIAGIILQQSYPLAPLTALFLCLVLLVPVLFSPQKHKAERRTLLLLLAVVLLGFIHAANFAKQALQETHIFARITQEEDSVLTGTLHSMPLFDGKKSTIIIKSHHLRLQDEEYFSPVQGLIQLRLKALWPPSFVPGDELVIRTLLTRPYRFGNPGSFDYPAFLDSKNIKIVGRISTTAHIHALEQETTSWLHSLTYLPERMRLFIKKTINNTFPQKEAGLYRALLIGDRSGLDKKQLESFKASGVFHILAISGLHLSIVASGLFVLFYWLARRSEYLMLRLSCKKLALLATIPPLCGYALLAGSQTPVLRALIMVVLFILSFCVERKNSPFTTLSFAALLILLINPKTLFSVSFQLSFAAVASLIFIFPRLVAIVQPKDAMNGELSPHSSRIIIRWIAAALLVSSVATIGTAPLLINSFNRISTIGPFANLILEPLLCLWSLPIGLLSIPILFISPLLGGWVLKIGGIGITASMEIADFLAELGFATLWLPTPSPVLIAFYYISLCFCFLHFSPKKSLVLFSTVCVLFFFPPRSFFERYSTESELVFLDVGQGSSTLLSFPGGKKVLIDGGGSSSKKFNVGESLIAPFLWSKGITHLDAVIITHPDSDHFNGIPFILQRFKPDTLWVNGNDGHDQGYDDLLNLANNLNIEIKTPIGNQVLIAENGARLQNIINPFLVGKNTEHANIRDSSNDKSLILKFTGGKKEISCLFPGDISREVESDLIKNHNKNTLHSSFLLAPHHGSKTSNSPLFLNSVSPKQIIVSAGGFQPLSFPSQGLRSYCEEKDIPLLNTSKIGAVTIMIDGNRLETHSFNQTSKPPSPVTL